MLKNIGTDKDFILSFEGGGLKIRAISPKGQSRLETLIQELVNVGLVIHVYIKRTSIMCSSQLDSLVSLLSAVKSELEATGYTVALPKYEADELAKITDTNLSEETLLVLCYDE